LSVREKKNKKKMFCLLNKTIRKKKKNEFNDILELLKSKNKHMIKDIERFSKNEYSFDIVLFLERIILFKKCTMKCCKLKIANEIFKEFIILDGKRPLTFNQKMIDFVNNKLNNKNVDNNLFNECIIKAKEDFLDVFTRWKNT
jgi:hypothetical protein